MSIQETVKLFTYQTGPMFRELPQDLLKTYYRSADIVLQAHINELWIYPSVVLRRNQLSFAEIPPSQGISIPVGDWEDFFTDTPFVLAGRFDLSGRTILTLGTQNCYSCLGTGIDHVCKYKCGTCGGTGSIAREDVVPPPQTELEVYLKSLR